MNQEVMTGKVPFSGKSDHSVMHLVTVKKEHPERPENHIPSSSRDGDKLWDLLLACWSFSPEVRPSAAAVAKVVSMTIALHVGLTVTLGVPDEDDYTRRLDVH
jgi:hypothetical protein